MDRYANRAWQFAKDIRSYHKKFSYFQKIVILSLIVGIASILYAKLLTVVLVYFLTVVATIATCHLLSSVDTNFTFGVSVVNFLLKHEEFLSNLFSFMKSLSSSNEQNNKNDLIITADDEDIDQFHDADDADDKDYYNGEKVIVKAAGTDKSTKQHELGEQKELDEQKEAGSAEKALPDGNWEDELKTLMDLVCRDFIQDWYDTFEASEDVSDDIQNILHLAAKHLCESLGELDMHKICSEFLLLYRQHLFSFQTARTLYKTQPKRRLSQRRLSSTTSGQFHTVRRINSIEEAFEIKFTYHIGVWGIDNETIYLRSIVQLILSQLIPEHIKNCNTSQLLVVEILTCNIFLPVIELLSEPDYLYELIIRILSDEKLAVPEDDISNPCESTAGDNEANDNETQETDLDTKDLEIDSGRDDVLQLPPSFNRNRSRSSDSLIVHQKHLLESSNKLSIPSSQKADNNIVLTKSKSCQESLDAFTDHRVLSSSFLTLPQPHQPHHQSQEDVEVHCERSQQLSVGSFEDIRCSENVTDNAQSSHIDIYLEGDKIDDYNVIDSLEMIKDTEGSDVTTTVRECDTVTTVNRSFTDISIIATETAQEMRSSTTYTLYHIQYDALYFNETGNLEHRTKEVKRRFREFVNLQARLEDNYLYKKSLRDVKGPKRWLSLPFGNMDKKSVESRRISLETFLRSLIVKEDICNGQELKEFLAYVGDAHIAFVRKAPEKSVPRLDKMLVKTVSGVIDKIGELSSKAQEKLPSLPGKKEISTPREEEGKPLEDQDQIRVNFCTLDEQVCKLQTALEKYVEQHQDPKDEDPEDEESHMQKGSKSTIHTADQQVTQSPSSGKQDTTVPEDTIFIADSVLDLGIQTLQTRGCWVCREKVVSMAKRLLGTALNRFLTLKIDSLTSEHMCYFYLHLLKNTVWPDGQFSNERKKVKTDKHKRMTQEQALRCLADFFPDILRKLVGEEDYQFGMNEIIESLQHKKLNKNFIFIFLDHLIEKLYPDISLKNLQEQLMR